MKLIAALLLSLVAIAVSAHEGHDHDDDDDEATLPPKVVTQPAPQKPAAAADKPKAESLEKAAKPAPKKP